LQARPLHQVIEKWLNNDDQAQVASWMKYDTEPGATAFALFLGKLSRSVNFSPKLKAAVAAWLSKLARDSELRALTFQVAHDSTTTCEDRVALTYNAMKSLSDAHEAAGGTYDDKLNELVVLGRGAFRLDALADVARRKVQSLRFVDEIEVYLAYVVRLRERLDLPTDLVDMRFFDVSGVTQEDLDNAKAKVEEREATEFSRYFLCEWEPWQSVLTRFAPDWRERENTMLTNLQPDFEQEVNAKLIGLGLSEDDSDVRIQTAAAVMKEHQLEVREKLAREILRDRGQETILDGILGSRRSNDMVAVVPARTVEH
jgi:E3 ubiquitin-protein ligase SspH2